MKKYRKNSGLNPSIDIFYILDDFTKDETVASGEDASMKADYVLDLQR